MKHPWVTVGAGRLCRVGCLGLVLWLCGCTSNLIPERYGNPPAPRDYDPALLTGELIFGETVASDEFPDIDLLGIDEAMLAFVREHVQPHRLAVSRLRSLLVELDERGYFNDSYEALVTRSAAETFHTKRGNCLSYTNMFIALARAADLDAYYQIVNVPPTWNASSGMLIRNNHINVLMRGARYTMAYSHEFTVDFNMVDPPDEFQRWTVSDTYATSLFYANVSVEALRTGETRRAFAYLKKALELVPGNSDLWINLGAFYGRFDQFTPALGAFNVALSLDADNRTALSGISRSYAALGETELAEEYAKRVRDYRDRNPYYHFAVAQTAFDEALYEESLAAVNQAIELKRHNARFHFMKALAERQLGDEEAARKSLSRARRYGQSYEDLRRRYAPDLAVLEG